eukprot:2881002-Amphidinium_carterae.1
MMCRSSRFSCWLEPCPKLRMIASRNCSATICHPGGSAQPSMASDALMEDTSFAAFAKTRVCILRISLMSGRHTCIVTYYQFGAKLIDIACTRLALTCRGSEHLLQGTREVPTEHP